MNERIILVGTDAIRCKNLGTLKETFMQPGVVAAVSVDELREGKGGMARAQILAAISAEQVVGVTLQEAVDLQEKGSEQLGTLRFGQETLLKSTKVLPELQIEQTSYQVDLTYMVAAKMLIQQGECWWRNTACLFARDNEILSEGFSVNPWCTECKLLPLKPKAITLNKGERIDFCNALHAEKAAISRATNRGVSLKDSTLYVTTCPCEECSKAVAEVGINRVVFDSEYYDREGIRLLQERGVEVQKIHYDSGK